jgi:ferredoxin
MRDLQRNFDAVFTAVGELKVDNTDWLGLETDLKGIKIDKDTYETSEKGIFAGGDAVRKRRLAVRSVADGKEAAVSIDQYLSGRTVTGPGKPFNTQIGKLKESENAIFLKCASDKTRVKPVADASTGLTDTQAEQESFRCLHCDCRKPAVCKLRHYSARYGARAGRFKDDRRLFEQYAQHPDIIYEPGKCIDCGLCIGITKKAMEPFGLTFIGRGFNVRVAVPFERSLADALQKTSQQCADACPTGALAFK